MNINVSKQASKNIFFGLILKIYQILIPFIMRTIIIYYLGIEYAGIGGLFASVMQMLNLAELGIATAIVYFMYRPIAFNDDEMVRGLLCLFRSYYRKVGLFIVMAGVVVMPFLHFIVSKDVPNGINIYMIYIINLLTTASSYMLFAYRGCLFSVHQRIDVINLMNIVLSTIQYILQIFVLVMLHSYYLYFFCGLLIGVINNIVTMKLTNKMYPKLVIEGTVSNKVKQEVKSKIKDLFLNKMGGVIVNSLDPIIISTFLGVLTLGKYQNYFLIIASIRSCIGVVESACCDGIGNKIQFETKEDSYQTFKRFSFMIWFLSVICISGIVSVAQPFMFLWMGENNILEFSIVILLCVYLYIIKLMSVGCIYENISGIWHYDRIRPLLEGLINLVLNILLVQWIGLFGVILSTVVSMAFFSYPWLIHNIFKHFFGLSVRKFYVTQFKHALITILAVVLPYYLNHWIPVKGILEILVKGFISVGISVFIIVIMSRKEPEFIWCRKKLSVLTRIKR